MMAKKKKKGHGGLKFLAFLVVVGSIIAAIKIGSGTEAGQRVLGHREDHRVEATALTPRFAYASATLKITKGSIYNDNGSPVDITTTRVVTIDRQSSTAFTDVTVEHTPTEVAPGVDAIPFDALNTAWSEVVTKDHLYESADDPLQPWTRSDNPPYYYGTELDDHYIPMIDDIVGFELRNLATKTAVAAPEAGLKSTVLRPSVDGPAATPALATTTYEMDFETFRRVVPILAGRTRLAAPPATAVTMTLGFDEVGLLHYADVAIPNSVATELAQALDTQHSALYHYTLEVTAISGEPAKIDIPTNYVDEPDATVPADGP